MTRPLLLGTAGHIDHGKTRLVATLTGVDTDRLPEEKARGISIDLGFAHWETEEFRFGIVDVPGHERFVRNMVAGASGVDIALLVVAADDGVMPQTREHLEIMDLLGLSSGVVALSKCDLVDEESLEFAREEVAETCAGTFLESAAIVPISSQTGAGFDELRAEIIAAARKIRSDHDDRERRPFRLPIDRAFSLEGHGSIITGSAMSGAVSAGDTLQLLPEGKTIRVRSVHSHGTAEESAGDRQRVAINVAGIKKEEIRRGQELATPDYLRPSGRLFAKMRVLSSAGLPIRSRQELLLHLGTRELPVRVILRPGPCEPGDEEFVEFRTREPVVATWGQRFILRRPSPATTLAGGVILDPGIPSRFRIADFQHFGARCASDLPAERLSHWLSQTDDTPTPLFAAWKVGLLPTEFDSVMQSLRESELRRIGDGNLHVERLSYYRDRLMRAVNRELDSREAARAMPERDLMAVANLVVPPALTAGVVNDLIKTGELIVRGEAVGPASRQVKLSARQKQLFDRACALIAEANSAPPTIKEISQILEAKPDQIEPLLQLAVEDGALVRISPEIFLTPAAVDSLMAILTEFFANHETGTLSQLREAWGITRKHAVPLAEWCDAHGKTVRQDNIRRLA